MWLKFWLAGHLSKTVGQLEQELTAREFEYWKLWKMDADRGGA